MEKEVNLTLPFLDVLIYNNDPNFSLTRVYRKKTFTGLSANYFSFTPYSYKVDLIKTLADRAYKINNIWLGFHDGITMLMKIIKNLFPAYRKDYKSLHCWDTKQSLSPGFPSHHFTYVLLQAT